MEQKFSKPSYSGSVPMVRIDGKEIRRLRESKKLTQLYLSTVVGVTTDTISRWENRHYQSIKLENAEKLAQALEVPFAEILKQKEEEPPSQESTVQEEQSTQPDLTRQRLPKSRRTILLSALLSFTFLGIALFSLWSRQTTVPVSASRILPPHVAPGQEFPVLIRIASTADQPMSLIIKEIFPAGTVVRQSIPPITSKDDQKNALKWISRTDKAESVYAYICRAPAQPAKENRLTFSGSITLKQKVSNRQSVKGMQALDLAPYHWADENHDYEIDDEEILAVYDTYSEMEELPIDRDLIDAIWAGSGYAWDASTQRFIILE